MSRDRRPPRILVVEDDEALRRMLATSLRRLGEVVTAASADEALASLGTGRRPTVVITDVMMPGTSGLELARTLRKDPRLGHVPIVILSAKHAPRDIVDGINAGARHYVAKPFKTSDLEAKIGKLIADARPPAEPSLEIDAGVPSLEMDVPIEIEIELEDVR